MVRIRTIDELANYYRSMDPNTSITRHWIRQLVLSNQISYHRAGNKYLINLDAFEQFLSLPVEGTHNSTI